MFATFAMALPSYNVRTYRTHKNSWDSSPEPTLKEPTNPAKYLKEKNEMCLQPLSKNTDAMAKKLYSFLSLPKVAAS